ncbi:hypothetical protein PoB_005816300 [Plakobranchus ocellatus]|uniref:Uncharacterized protein n=1 Tax=Plakobranchus ocellatus TaxID=259542 RepID=A0AAV4CI53_9GAST|nr:hypothetical protein PoB_005816300 [Plakobranchus ocellatus]
MKGALSVDSLSVEMDTGGLRDRESETVRYRRPAFSHYLYTVEWCAQDATALVKTAQKTRYANNSTEEDVQAAICNIRENYNQDLG